MKDLFVSYPQYAERCKATVTNERQKIAPDTERQYRFTADAAKYCGVQFRAQRLNVEQTKRLRRFYAV